MSETHGRADQPSVMEAITGYKTWNTERSGNDKNGGGLTILYRESLVAHQWIPTVPSTLSYVSSERQWLLLNLPGGKKCAFLSIYVACQSFTSDHYMQWNEDLFHLVTQEAINLRRQGFMVLAMGDFNTRIGQVPGLEGNTRDVNSNHPMFMGFVSEVNLFILNTLPISKGLFTRFMSGSQTGSDSLLDYGLIDVDHVNTVSSFIIDEDARYECGSDHALLECEIVLVPGPRIDWSVQDVIHYNFHENTDFTLYKSNCDQAMKGIPLDKFADLSAVDMLPHITDSINSSAKKSFGLKIKKKKRGLRLPKNIITLIKEKNELSKTLKNCEADLGQDEVHRLSEELQDLKLRIKEGITDVKILKRKRFRLKMLRSDPTRRRFWRFLKSQTKAAGCITALYKVYIRNRR